MTRYDVTKQCCGPRDSVACERLGLVTKYQAKVFVKKDGLSYSTDFRMVSGFLILRILTVATYFNSQSPRDFNRTAVCFITGTFVYTPL